MGLIVGERILIEFLGRLVIIFKVFEEGRWQYLSMLLALVVPLLLEVAPVGRVLGFG